MTLPVAPPRLLAVFGATDPDLVFASEAVTVWKVHLASGQPAALKHYRRGDMGNEAGGFDYLQAVGPSLAVEVWGRTADAVLMAWLDGPSLGDQLRSGAAQKVDRTLGEVAVSLKGRVSLTADLPRLDDWMHDLLTLEITPDCPTRSRLDIDYCKAAVRDLLATTDEVQPLHGDLHHDNIILTAAGPRVFDAKGVLGDPAYEVANAFRSPKGAGPEVFGSPHLDWRATTWAAALDVDRGRLLRWGAVKAALSLAWQSNGRLGARPGLGLLSRLVDLARH